MMPGAVHSAEWWIPPEFISMPAGDVHLWKIPLDISKEEIEQLYDLLSEDERVRGGRFMRETSRWQYVTTRIALRLLLGRYLTCSPKDLCFRCSPCGKPELDDPAGDTPIRFNVSHVHGMALIAVAHGRALGVDLERVQVDKNLEFKGRWAFHSDELDALPTGKCNYGHAAFYLLWTQKEAYLKAIGVGLTVPFKGSFPNCIRLTLIFCIH